MIIIISSVVCALVLISTLGVLKYQGFFDSSSETTTIKVPDLNGLDEKSAKELLEKKGLVLSDDITYEVTDDIEEGLIFEQTPIKGKKVKKGTSIKIKISSGKYFIVESYVGLTYDQLEAKLQNTKITILVDYQESTTTTAGVIMEQSLLYEGDKIKPNVSKQIRVVIATTPEFYIENYKGAKVETVKSQLEAKGIKVNLEQKSTDGMSDEEIEALEKGVVISQTPEAGTYYKQEGNNVVTLYYY